MAFVIGDQCVDRKDRTCTSHCPVDCIYEGATKLYIHPDECIDCGACESVCPVEAIFYDAQPAPGQERQIEANREFFVRTGVSGGATSVGPLDVDVLQVRE